jgi:hypothetical protein
MSPQYILMKRKACAKTHIPSFPPRQERQGEKSTRRPSQYRRRGSGGNLQVVEFPVKLGRPGKRLRTQGYVDKIYAF